VHRARHAFTGREVALKVLKGGVIESAEAAQRFLREARAPAAIAHPALVEVLDAGVDEDGGPYLALELLEGEDLGRALAAGRVDTGELVRIARELLSALAVAHAAGVVHRDVKPQNVFLEEAPGRGARRVRLLDLGLVRGLAGDQGTVTRTGAFLGTPAFMSPEQLRGERVDARADLWAVGAILYGALGGRPPYITGARMDVTAALSRDPDPLGSLRPDIPAALAAVIDRAVRHDPAHRFASADGMAMALAGAAGAADATAAAGRPLLAGGPETRQAGSRRAPSALAARSPGSRRGVIALALLAAAVLAVVGGLAVIWMEAEEPATTEVPMLSPAPPPTPAAEPVEPVETASGPPAAAEPAEPVETASRPPASAEPAEPSPRPAAPPPRRPPPPRPPPGEAVTSGWVPAPGSNGPDSDPLGDRRRCIATCTSAHAECVRRLRLEGPASDPCNLQVLECRRGCDR
jgi:serine/threonine-protein kinase